VYYYVDEWAQFTLLDAAFIREEEAELLKRVDVTFVVSQKLLEDKRRQGSHVHLVAHGVDHPLFARALDPSFVPAPQLDGLQRPMVGFYGTLYDWVDQQLIVDMAKLRPGWSFVLVGTIMTDITLLRSQPNIHMVKSRPHDELPPYCKGFDVGIIPFRMDDPRMQSVNPLTLREYLAAGLPVVTVDLPEVHGMGEGVFIAGDAEAFVAAVEEALQRNDSASRQARSDRMRSESWEARVASIEAVLSGIGVA